jgi:hypothetical protein
MGNACCGGPQGEPAAQTAKAGPAPPAQSATQPTDQPTVAAAAEGKGSEAAAPPRPGDAAEPHASSRKNFAREEPSIPHVLAMASVKYSAAILGATSSDAAASHGDADDGSSLAGELPIVLPIGRMHGGSSGANVVCKLHAPEAFRRVRESVGVDEDQFCLSLQDVKEIGNPGKGGQRLFRTADKQYFLKTMEPTELEMLERFLRPPIASGLPAYTEHMQSETLLCTFVGWYSVEMEGDITWLVAMRNILPSTVCRAEKLLQFDLKGSVRELAVIRVCLARTAIDVPFVVLPVQWYGRRASSNELSKGRGATLKDLDFWHDGLVEDFNSSRFVGPNCLCLGSDNCATLLRRIDNALDFLGKHGVMDHSLLMGLYEVTDLHCVDPACTEQANGQDGGWFAEADVRIDKQGNLLQGDQTRKAKFIVHCGVIDVLQTYNVGRKVSH